MEPRKILQNFLANPKRNANVCAPHPQLTHKTKPKGKGTASVPCPPDRFFHHTRGGGGSHTPLTDPTPDKSTIGIGYVAHAYHVCATSRRRGGDGPPLPTMTDTLRWKIPLPPKASKHNFNLKKGPPGIIGRLVGGGGRPPPTGGVGGGYGWAPAGGGTGVTRRSALAPRQK